MSQLKLLEQGLAYDIQPYQGEGNLEADAIAFSGALRQHYNPNMVVLLSRPLESDGVIYEFRVDDILHIEEIDHLTRQDGLTVEQVRVWVRKGSLAMKMQPFQVGPPEELR